MALQNFIKTLDQKARPPIETTEKGIPFDTLKTPYLEAFNRIGWQPGLMARLEVIQAKNRLNEVWLEAMEGKTTLDDFKRTLAGWERVISGAING